MLNWKGSGRKRTYSNRETLPEVTWKSREKARQTSIRAAYDIAKVRNSLIPDRHIFIIRAKLYRNLVRSTQPKPPVLQTITILPGYPHTYQNRKVPPSFVVKVSLSSHFHTGHWIPYRPSWTLNILLFSLVFCYIIFKINCISAASLIVLLDHHTSYSMWKLISNL